MDFDPARFVSADDLDEQATDAKLRSQPPRNNVAMALWKDARLVWSAIRNDQVTMAGYASAALALAYFVCPVDFVPDIIPIAGYGDDLMVIRWALSQLARRG